MLGGSVLNYNYWGYIEYFSLWKVVRIQWEILFDMEIYGVYIVLFQFFFQENWDNVKYVWFFMKDGSSFKVEFSNVYGFLLDMSLEFFLCGQILCDNIEVIVSYNQFLSFCQFKVVCYCVVNFYEDDYKNLMVMCEQVDFQYYQLVEVFK